MTLALFRVRLPDGSRRLARGDSFRGPAELLAAGLSIEGLLRGGRAALLEALRDRPAEGVFPTAPWPSHPSTSRRCGRPA